MSQAMPSDTWLRDAARAAQLAGDEGRIGVLKDPEDPVGVRR